MAAICSFSSVNVLTG